MVNARHFVAQSRPRLFIVGTRTPLTRTGNWQPSDVRPAWIARFVARYPDLRLQPFPIALPPSTLQTLPDVVERYPATDRVWWDGDRQARFLSELSPTQQPRSNLLVTSQRLAWATAYRRTRNGKPAWRYEPTRSAAACERRAADQNRPSSKRAGDVRVRWMTAREYARLQGATDYNFDGVPDNQALFGFGDAVCVPAVGWLVREYLVPLITESGVRGVEGHALSFIYA